MIITNNKGYKEPVFNMCKDYFSHEHNKDGELSITTSKNDIREILLSHRHGNEIEVDISDLIPQMIGTAFHSEAERHTGSDAMTEQKFTFKISNTIVTGRIDGYVPEEKSLYDYKTCKVWKFVNKDFEDWKYQGIGYAWLLSKSGIEVNKCQFLCVFTDHSRMDALRSSDYPQNRSDVFEFDVSESDLITFEKLITNKVKEYEEYLSVEDDKLPVCSEKNRWNEPDFGVFKDDKAARALKAFNHKNFPDKTRDELYEMAEKYKSEINGILKDRSSDKKCLAYCQCCKFCSYWREHYSN